MRRRTHAVLSTIILIQLALLVGCREFNNFTTGAGISRPREKVVRAHPNDKRVLEWANRAGQDLDRVALALEEFGTISVSSPLLAPAKKFDFAVDAGPNDYFKDAKNQVQGRVAVADLFAQQTAVGLRGQGDINALLGGLDVLAAHREALGDYETKRRLTRHAARLRAQQEIDKLPPNATPAERAAAEERAALILAESTPGSATTRPAYEAPPPATLPSVDADLLPAPDQALKVLGSDQFTAIRGLLAGTETALQNRAALNIAAGDAATEAIFSLLGSPNDYIKFEDKRVLFGAGMVAVSPGWRTKTNFAADVSVTTEFVYVPARREYRDGWLDYVNRELKGNRKPDHPELLELKKLLERVQQPTPEAAEAKTKSTTVDGGELVIVADTYPIIPADNDQKGQRKSAQRRPKQPRQQQQTSEQRGQQGQQGQQGQMQGTELRDAGPGPQSDAGAHERVFLMSADPVRFGLRMQPLGGATPGGGAVAAGQGLSSGRVTASTEVDPRFRLPDVPPSPLVAAVSPMTDAEVLDLSSSVRQQRAFALSASLALQYAGLAGQAQVFDQWAKRLERDTVTRGASAAVSTYSHSGGMFGFQIGPRLRAVGGGGTANRPARELERQTFPVLIAIGMDAADLEPRFGDVDGVLTAFEPVIVFRQSMRWVPVDQPRAVQRKQDDALRALHPERYEKVMEYSGLRRGVRETERLDWAIGLDGALDRAPWTTDERRAALQRIDDALYGLAALQGKPVSATAVRLDRNQRLALQTAEALLAGLKDPTGRQRWARTELARANRAMRNGQPAPLSDGSVRTAIESVEGLLETAENREVHNGDAVQATRGRVSVLTYHAIGSSNWQYLPIDAVLNTAPPEKEAAPKLVVNDAGTLEGFDNGVSYFVITGDNMNGRIVNAAVSPRGNNLGLSFVAFKGAVVVQVAAVDATNNAGGAPVDLFLVDDKGTFHHAAKLKFTLPPQANADAGLKIEHDDKSGTTRVMLNGRELDLSPEEVVKLVEALQRNDPGIRLETEASGGFRLKVDGQPRQQQQQQQRQGTGQNTEQEAPGQQTPEQETGQDARK